jgi:hypothetical protein
VAAGDAIHIGLNNLSEFWYGEPSTLLGAENDARAMLQIASEREFRTKPLIGPDATAEAVRSALDDAAAGLVSGDSLIITFSGHGRPIEDLNGDEPRGLDQTWCLYDRMFIDDEVYSALLKFHAGVRILVISDSCYSGSSIEVSADVPRVKKLTDSARDFSLRKQAAEYDRVRVSPRKRRRPTASVILLAACQDDQKALDGDPNGRFTEAVLGVWARGAFKGNLRKFLEEISSRMPPEQTPNWYPVGRPDAHFEAAAPFSL